MKPWEEYQSDAQGPWSEYAQPSAPSVEWVETTPPDVLERQERVRKTPEWQKKLMTAAQGPAFGFADEAFAAAKALAGGDYRKERDYYRAITEGQMADAPIQSTGLQLAASAPLGFTGLTRAVAGKAATPLMSYLQAAKTGGLFGALQGAGEAENVQDIPMGMLKQGGAGAITSPMMMAGGRGIGGVYQNIASRLADKPAEDVAYRRVAEALARDNADTGRMQRKLDWLGPGARLYQGAGRGSESLLDTMAIMPGKTKDLVSRAAKHSATGRGGRLAEAAVEGLGTGGARSMPTFEVLNESRRVAASPIYEELRGKVIPTTETLAKILDRPVVKNAIAQAERNAQNRNETLPDVTKSNLNFEHWDDIKQGLDDVIGQIKRGTSDSNVSKDTLRAAMDTKKAILEELDRITFGQYKKARDLWSGPSAMIDALEEGRTFWKMPTDELSSIMSKMPDSEKQAFRIGASEFLRDKLGKQGGQTEMMKYWREPATREKLKAIFPDTKSYGKFVQALQRENKLKSIESVGQGSRTAERMLGADQTAADTTSDILGMTGGSPTSMLSKVLKLYGKATTPEPVRDRIGNILMSQDTGELAKIRTYEEALARSRQGQAGMSGLLGSILPNW